MAATAAGWLLNNLRSTYKHVTGCNVHPGIFLQTREYAARKGTREKAKKKKVKVVIQKVGFVPHNVRKTGKEAAEFEKVNTHAFEATKMIPIDDVWVGKFFRWKIYPFVEAVQCHRETHHPTMYNLPTSSINALIELNTKAEKGTKAINSFTRIVDVPHKFESNEDRRIIVFAKSTEAQKIAKEAGANMFGGRELIKQIQEGHLHLREFDHHLAHMDMLPDLLLIRGLMRTRFPSAKSGTLGENMRELVEKFRWGVKYTVKSHEQEKYYGIFEVRVGTLDMDITHLEENFAAIIQDIDSMRPKREGEFITRVRLVSPPSGELLKVDFSPYLVGKDNAEEEGDDTAAVIATN